jgi:hemoglobin
MPDEAAISSVYAMIGEAGFRRLVAAFYRRVPNDDLLGPLYPPHDLQGAEDRLRGFLIFRFGGPDSYVSERGHPKLRMRHAPFVIDQTMRDRWISLMEQAISEAELPAKAVEILRLFLAEVATFLINRASGPSLIA